jgi:hypothetical protein
MEVGMISSLGKSVLQRLFAVAAILLLSLPAPQTARAQESDDIDQTVARISYIQGPVSYGRGDDPDNWDPAIVNVPFTLGDRIYSSTDGRAELQLPGGNFVRIGRQSYLNALTLTYDTKQFYLGNGAATINIRRLDPDEIFEIDTPNMAVTFDTPGRYRVEVDDDGNTRVVVRRGTAVVAANGRQVTVEQAEIRVYGTDSPQYEIVGLRAPDAFDHWVDERNDRFERAYSPAYQYADEEIVGVEDLAQYGRWEEIPDYGPAWTPTQVAVGWQPFTVGHWFWQDPWGWSWISEEPWGWAPCHYGRWTYYRSRWYWVPVRRRVEVVRYAPAVVEFVRVREHIGWFPLHPRDRFVPWWGRRGRVEDVTYVNRTRVVVIDQETFVSGRRVTTRIVRDTTIIREVTTVRVRESLPIPRRESIRVVSERRQVQRPPANILSRAIVVRTAPLPPPPRFEEKLRVVQERKGQPLSPEEIQAMGAKNFKANQGVRIRPAAAGRGDFAPRNQSVSTPAPQPVTPPKGRKLATADAPVVTELPSRQKREQERQERQVQDQQRKDQPREERQLQKQEKQPQEQQRKDQPPRDDPQRKEQERRQEEQERQKKQQEQERQKQEKFLQEQQRKGPEQEKQQQKQQQEQERQRKDQQLKEQQQRDEQQRKEQERQQQEQERQKKQQEQERQKQLQDQQRKEQQLQQQKQQRDEQQRKEQERQKQQDQDRQQRLQEQERQKQLQEQQRQQQQIQKDQQRQEQERKRQEKQQQEQQRKEQEQQGRELERQQKIQQEQARQKQIQEQRKEQQIRKEQERRKEDGQGQGKREEAPPPQQPPPPPR